MLYLVLLDNMQPMSARCVLFGQHLHAFRLFKPWAVSRARPAATRRARAKSGMLEARAALASGAQSAVANSDWQNLLMMAK